jgi:hypothetical protein
MVQMTVATVALKVLTSPCITNSAVLRGDGWGLECFDCRGCRRGGRKRMYGFANRVHMEMNRWEVLDGRGGSRCDIAMKR